MPRGNQPDDEQPGLTAEDEALIVDSLIEEMSGLFHDYLSGEIEYAELSFEMFETLQTLHAIASGNVSVEWEESPGESSPQSSRHDGHEHWPSKGGSRQKGRGQRGH